jgi:predicted SnoaL-like aldol condensation-catalyzing enzyme
VGVKNLKCKRDFIPLSDVSNKLFLSLGRPINDSYKIFVHDVLRDDKVTKSLIIFPETCHQHNPGIGDGLDGLGKGNFVLTLSEGQFAGKHVAFYDLFRVESGKMEEHWDVIQEIPPKESWKKQNGKF